MVLTSSIVVDNEFVEFFLFINIVSIASASLGLEDVSADSLSF